MRSHRIALIASVAFLAAPASAGAAEVSFVADDLIYEGFDSENNALVITTPTTDQATVVDAPGVVISPGAGCSNPEADNTATCGGSGILGMDVETRGGNDLVDLRGVRALGGSGVDTNAGAGNDTVLGTDGRDNILGGAGNDVLQGGRGTDRTFGGAGLDISSYELETAPITVDMAPGTARDGPAGANDDVNPDGSTEGVIGGSGGDTILGSAEADRIDGAGGDDVIDGGAGSDNLSGGADTDGIDGGPDSDRISGDGGEGAGDPVQDFLLGGSELDAVVYDERSIPVVVDLEDPGLDGSAGEDDDLAEFEGVIGGEGDDVIVGDPGANTLLGGLGDDLIDGGLGLDELLGGNGSDTVSYARRTSPVSVVVGPHGGGGEANEGDHIEGMENVRGGDGPDSLRGDDSPNELDGGPGDDTLRGGGDRDLLQGGDGADTLNGEDGDDTVSGDAGLDTADGGAGGDALRMRDGESETVVCGTELDTAIVDPVDALDGCETSDSGVPPQPVREVVQIQVPGAPSSPGPPVPAAPGAQAPDATSPIALGSLKSTQKLASFKKGLKIAVGCDEPCSFDLELLGSASSVKLARSYDLRLAAKSLSRASGTRSVTLKPSSRLLRGHKRLTVQLKVTAVDAAGNKSTKTKTMKVR